MSRIDIRAPRIQGNVYADFNADGANNDNADGILDGWIVYLDTDNNGQLDAGETTAATSGRAGFFDFGKVAPGTYTVRQQMPNGWTQTSPVSGVGHVLTVADGDGPIHVDFANQVPTATTVYPSIDVGQQIRKSSSPVTSTLEISETSQIFDLNVHLDISHTYVRDLEVYLDRSRRDPS